MEYTMKLPSYEEVIGTFVDLTRHNSTKPDFISEILPILNCNGMMKDKEVEGVYFKKIGNPNIVFTAHYDTASDSEVTHNVLEDAKHIMVNGSKGILGADDKAGLTVLKYMMDAEVEGLYVFFGDEEIGSTQSKRWIKTNYKEKCELEQDITIAIAFDRKGYGDFITKQHGDSCCSDKYADKFIEKLAEYGLFYAKTPGVFTDTANMIYYINECTNLSIGYFDHHMDSERQDLRFLHKVICVMIEHSKELFSIPHQREIPIQKTYADYSGVYNRPTWQEEYGYWDRDKKCWIDGTKKKEQNPPGRKMDMDLTATEPGMIVFEYGADTIIGIALIDAFGENETVYHEKIDKSISVDEFAFTIGDVIISIPSEITPMEYIETVEELMNIGRFLCSLNDAKTEIAFLTVGGYRSDIVTYPIEYSMFVNHPELMGNILDNETLLDEVRDEWNDYTGDIR